MTDAGYRAGFFDGVIVDAAYYCPMRRETFVVLPGVNPIICVSDYVLNSRQWPTFWAWLADCLERMRRELSTTLEPAP